MIAVIGGINIDIGAWSKDKLSFRDSNPGTVRTSIGGVGFNIARNIALLGEQVTMFSVLGGDANASKVLAECEEYDIDVSHLKKVPELNTSTYLFINDETGDMALAVNDMGIIDRIDESYISEQLDAINAADAVVIDANLSAETIAFIADHAAGPIFADPVSGIKAERLRPVLGKLYGFKPNLMEAEMLAGHQITTESELLSAAGELLSTGLKQVFISLGAEGILAAEGDSYLRMPGTGMPVVSTTGGGDSVTAATAVSHVRGLGLEETARLCMGTASYAVGTTETVCRELSFEKAYARGMNIGHIN